MILDNRNIEDIISQLKSELYAEFGAGIKTKTNIQLFENGTGYVCVTHYRKIENGDTVFYDAIYSNYPDLPSGHRAVIRNLDPDKKETPFAKLN